MLQLTVFENTPNGGAELFIDYQSESIGFTVIHDKDQFNFSIEREEWEQFKGFIETAISLDIKTGCEQDEKI